METPSTIRTVPTSLRDKPSRDLLIMGWDTQQIAIAKGVTEAEVYNEIGRQRGIWAVPLMAS